MTEAEWLTCADPSPMLSLLRDKANDRKMRLFSVLCCRRIAHFMTDEKGKGRIDVAERYADGQATEDERITASDEAQRVVRDAVEYREENDAIPEMFCNAARAARALLDGDRDFGEVASAIVSACRLIARDDTSGLGSWNAENAAHTTNLRDIFGNPFRPVTFDPAWRTTTAVQLAQVMYDARDFAAMPILADALQDAGCENTDILDHCRGPGPHVRGCWVVDLVLGKE
jgi:hypothetical protein